MQETTTVLAVKDLEVMDRAALIKAWQQVFAGPVPKGLSRAFLRRLLAIELQSRQFGGLPKRVKVILSADPHNIARPTSPALKPGGRLLREWNGVTHIVDVIDNGFSWKGTRYRSLSAIAREITGAHWSGPRFFGLNKKAKP